MAQVKVKRSNKSTGLVGFNPPPIFSTLESRMPFTSYNSILESYYKLRVRSTANTATYPPEVQIGEIPPVNAMPVTRLMLGTRYFAREHDGIELYLIQPLTSTRMTLCSVNEVAPGYLNFILQGHSTSLKKLNVLSFLPHLVNSMILKPLFPRYVLGCCEESKIPLRLTLPSGEWIPVKVTQGERLSVQTYCNTVDSPAFPARVGQTAVEPYRWNTRYIGSSRDVHNKVQLSELHAVEVRSVEGSLEAQFDPDHNLDD